MTRPTNVNALQPDLSLAANLRRLAVLMKDAPGDRIDPAGTVFALQADAAAAPIYWCCNWAHELALLGQAFGPGQPLAGMRSLNQVVTIGPGMSGMLDDLAAHYADALVTRFGRRPCTVGGNCQAGSIAWRVAMRLRAAGVPVRQLVIVDSTLRLPYPGAIRVLFGQNSTAFNPDLTPPEDPLRPVPWHWDRAWHRVESRVVPGGHGQYFQPHNLPFVVQAILHPPDPDPGLTGPQAESLAACRQVRCKTVHVAPDATTIEVTAGPMSHKIRGLAVLPLWTLPDGGLLRVPGADWIVPVQTLPVWRRRMPSPAPGQQARLEAVLCMAGHGPLTWDGWGTTRSPAT